MKRTFREPDGWRVGIVWIAVGCLFLGLDGYYRFFRGGGTGVGFQFGGLI